MTDDRYHQDQQGRPLLVGDIVRWRERLYTLAGFGQEDDIYGVSTLIFAEPLHAPGPPHEMNVSKYEARDAHLTAWGALAKQAATGEDGVVFAGTYMTPDGMVDLELRRVDPAESRVVAMPICQFCGAPLLPSGACESDCSRDRADREAV